MKLLKGKKGFTLIELVIVIAILGILAGLAIPRFLDATASARGSRIVADLRTIDSAIVIYNAKTGALPKTSEDITTDKAATTTALAQYKLLASWPVPPTGSCIITNNAGAQYKWDNTTKIYEYDATNGRGTLNKLSASDLLDKANS